MKVLIFATHPIQYQAPIYKELHKIYHLKIIYLLNQTSKQQADAGFGVEFDWDVPLLDGYNYQYLKNHSPLPSSSTYNGVILKNEELDELMLAEKPDIVLINGWFPKGLKQIINYCFQKKIKTICRGDSTLLMTNNYIKKIAKEIYIRSIVKKINAFLYVGEENKKYYLHYGIKEKQLFPGLHCINTPFFENEFSNIQQTETDKTLINIGFAGKFIDKKQPLLLLEAINQSKYKNRIILQLIGDGPLKSDIIKFSRENNVNINFLGFLNQTQIVGKGYAKIDFLVLPSNINETWGLVVNEVMTGGIPTIVSDTVGCHTDLIKSGKTGFTFKSGSALDLSLKIDKMAELLTKQKEEVKTEVLNHIKKYSLAKTVEGYQNAINSLM